MERRIEASRAREATLQEEAKKLEAEVGKLRDEQIQAARAAQEHEALLSRLEQRLDELRAEAESRSASLHRRELQMHGTIAALQRLARNPPETLLIATAEPIDAVRGAMLLKAAIPAIQLRARSLRQEIDGLERVRAEIGGEMERFTQANAGLARERKRLETLLAAKSAMQSKTVAQYGQAAKQVAALTEKAATLRELFERLEEAAPPPPPVRPSMAPPGRPDPAPAPAHPPALRTEPPPQGVRSFPADGAVTMPVQGRLMERYGQATAFGGTSKGLSFATREAAQVVAPYDGRIMFAGPFRGYGQILIIEHRGGYHTLLAGLQRVDGQVGQWVLAGEPVGVMGSEGTPTLYVELRRSGQPINPLPWFAADTNKVRG